MGWPWDEIEDAIDETVDIAVDVATGDWAGAAATVVREVGQATGIEELETVADVVETGSWTAAARFAADAVADALPEEAGQLVRGATAVATGDWKGAANVAMDLAGDSLPPQLVQLGNAALSGGVDGAVDFARNAALQAGTELASQALGDDAADLIKLGTTFAEGGSDAVLKAGAEALDSYVPGAGGVATQVLSGASPGDVMEGLLDSGKSQLMTVGKQAITGTGLDDDVAAVMATLDAVTGQPIQGPGTAAGADADDGDAVMGVMTARAPGTTSDDGVGDDLDLTVATSGAGQAASVPGDAFDDTPDFDVAMAGSDGDAVMAQVEEIEAEPSAVERADDIGDQAIASVNDLFEDPLDTA